MKLMDKLTPLMLKVSKKSPEILIGVGIVGIGSAIVMACRNTLKCKDELEEKQDSIEKFKDETATGKNDLELGDDLYKRNLTKLYFDEAIIVVKHYAPVVVIAGLSVGCILKSHNIMAKRNAALMAAYATLDEAFRNYRDRVREAVGNDKERAIYLGAKEEKKIDVVDTDEEGNEKVTKENGMVVDDPSKVSQYARFFDESSDQWSKSAEYNKSFLINTQSMMNDRLKARGHVFLNEVYDALGLERSQAGAVVGWILGAGDDFIDFGIYDVYTNPRRAAFVNGFERSILLDFNVDGVIFDKI